MGDTCYGVKWRSFKMVLVLQKTLSDPALHLATPHLINLDTDPKERNPYDFPYLHTWVIEHTGKILRDFQLSVQREPFIPVGAPLDYVPTTMQWKLMFHRHARRSAEKFRASKRLRALAPAGVGDRP
jgi:hypothetical protein